MGVPFKLLLRAMGGVDPFAEPANTQTSDLFNRADSASSLGSTSTGQAWTAHAGTWGIAGNKAYCVTRAGDSMATFDAGVSDFDLSVDAVVENTDTCVVFRWANITNYNLLQIDWTISANTVGTARIWKVVAGVFAPVAGPYNVPAGTAAWRGKTINLRIVANGASMTGFIDGVSALSGSDAANQTATRVGLFTNKATPANRAWENLIVLPVGGTEAKRYLTFCADRYSPSRLLASTAAPKVFEGWANPSKEGATLAAGDRWKRKALGNSSPQQVFIDTDFSADPEDAYALKAALAYQSEGVINIRGIAVCTSHSKAPGAVQAVCEYYGYPSIPIASYAPVGTLDPTPDTWSDAIYDNYPHTGVGLAATVTDTNAALTAWMNAAPAGCKYVMLGFARALVTWLQLSAANVTLFASKVSAIYAMVGAGGGGGEFNLINDTVAWDWLNTNSPVPIHWAFVEYGSTAGNIGDPTYYNARQTSTSDVIRFATLNSTLSAGVGRPCWDTSAVVYAVEGAGVTLTTVQQGSNAINTGTQRNTWTAGAGRDFAIFLTGTGAHVKNYCQSVLASDIQKSNLTWNGSTWA